ncbi:hypothetical protein EC846_2003 [Acinetobacter sp. BIGb0102]|jgi:hypothetical protein|nr:hypothetical protein EC846_2003 [Acinetobacter sp. BIGb0102]
MSPLFLYLLFYDRLVALTSSLYCFGLVRMIEFNCILTNTGKKLLS